MTLYNCYHGRPWDLEPYYSRHVSAMTSEGLHSRADIAAELAFRDRRIAELAAKLEQAKQAHLDAIGEYAALEVRARDAGRAALDEAIREVELIASRMEAGHVHFDDLHPVDKIIAALLAMRDR